MVSKGACSERSRLEREMNSEKRKRTKKRKEREGDALW